MPTVRRQSQDWVQVASEVQGGWAGRVTGLLTEAASFAQARIGGGSTTSDCAAGRDDLGRPQAPATIGGSGLQPVASSEHLHRDPAPGRAAQKGWSQGALATV